MSGGARFTINPKPSVRPAHSTPFRSFRTPITAVSYGDMASPTMRDPHPSLEVTGGARDKFLPAFKTLHLPYTPFPIIGWNRHLETIFAAFCRSFPDVKYKRECLRTEDNGTVALDWVAGDHRSLPADTPILILLPGLTGCSEDSYVKHMLVRAWSKGWRVLAYNSRGCGSSPVTTPQFYSGSFIEDLREVVAHVSARYPNANLYAVGWSLGGNIHINYLAKESHNCPLSGAASLCNPFNLVIADENLRKGFNKIYDRSLRTNLSGTLKKHAILFEDIEGEYNISVGMNPKTVREYDEAITRVSFGFKSVDDYYSNASSANYIKHVQIHLLCIQAANDPMAPISGTPFDDIKENSNCMLIVTPKGGHLGWVAGDEAPFGAPWTDPLVMDFLEYLEKDAGKPDATSSKKEDIKQELESMQQV